ncbi:type I polyketide synthase [Chroococcus sp. FPU101]|uniref:type I polyketide synthase n=1 Tax=Chroococcus sp. FPU101 TaxID=1974212 RepID=UPI001A8CBA65|nr:type I polyketide synthase [Chroococcus sp. FPU101]GFE67450.1 polyketide synthase [Chroococcus sp. FPU101]
MSQIPDYRSLMQNALLELREMRAKLKDLEAAKTEPIAIIGMGCRFPNAENPDAFWQLLKEGKNAITEVPPNRWNIDEYYDPEPNKPGKMYTRYGGFIEQLAEFDPQFFGISPREVESLDPQQRLLLEVAWEALENAGIIPQKLYGSETGVFIGISSNDYSQQLLTRNVKDIDAYLATGNSHSVAAGRLSFTLGLTGPSLAVDTACSSSLVAVHLAVRSLLNNECNLALVGGVNRILSPEFSINFCQAHMLAADGQCKTFDAAADGFVRAEGCGMIVLKKLSDAIADQDNILAVIRGTAINQDGRSSGLTVPNGPSQQKVIKQALENAKVLPEQISYIEAHGTGTALGDPIEIGAIGAVFGKNHTIEQPLLVGSVKTNFGHLEAAAGIAGLIKVVLSLQHQEIPPHLHFQTPNPLINWDTLPITIPTTSTLWPKDEQLAGVSSFGFSGTNAHIILEAAPKVDKHDVFSDRPVHLLTISSKSGNGLDELAQRYQSYLVAHPSLNLGDICFSANTGRAHGVPSAAHFQHCLSLVAASTTEVIEKLAAFREKQEITGLYQGFIENQECPKIAFLFTGQGSQYLRMGEELYQTQPLFRNTLNHCAEILRPYLEAPLLEVLYPTSSRNFLDETQYTQPALFALEYALYQLWTSWGIEPDYVMGHSVGEYVAACVAGVFSLEDGLKLITTRARLMQALPQIGEMVAVTASGKQLISLLEPYQKHVSIAAFNGENNTVISGEKQAISEIIQILQEQGIKTKKLLVSHAFHSPLIEPMLDEFETVARQINYATPRLKIVSNLTGNFVTEEIAAPQYWCRHIRQPVRFSEGINRLKDCPIFLEIGAKPTLIGMAHQILDLQNETDYSWLPSLRIGQSDWQSLLFSLATLSVKGVKIDWLEFDKNYPRRRIALPTYPFERQPYWFKQSSKPQAGNKANFVHPLLGQKLNLAKLESIHFENELDLDTFAFLQDHRVFDQIVFPMAAYLEMGIAAAKILTKNESLVIKNCVIHQLLILDGQKLIQLIVSPEYNFDIFSFNENSSNWLLHGNGQIINESVETPKIDLKEIQKKCDKSINVNRYYEQFKERGINYGETFRAITDLWQNSEQALGYIKLPEQLKYNLSDYQFHPVLLDACLQVIGATFEEDNLHKTYLPIGIESFTVYPFSTPLMEVWSYAELQPLTTKVDLKIFDLGGKIIISIEGLQLKLIQSETALQDWLYEIQWRTQEQLENQFSFSNYLLTPEAIQTNLSPTFQSLLEQPDLITYQELLSQLEILSIDYVLKSFEEMGEQFQEQDCLNITEITQKLKINHKYLKLFNRLLEMLVEEGILDRTEHQWRVIRKPKYSQISLDKLLKVYPLAIAELTLLERCGSHLAEVLQGNCEPKQLLFPEEDLTTVTKLYQDSPGAKVMNIMMQKTVTLAIEKIIPSGQKVRILEIGAGTGGTTSYLLPNLNPTLTEYYFTDVSTLFTSQAQQKFKDYPFVKYQILDIERDPKIQGFDLEEYDIVIAANVVHATQNLRQTLTHIHQLLSPRGILVLLEGTQPLRWFDLIFGLTEGWWKFNDTDIRSSYPLISAKRWIELLNNNGFEQAVTLTPDGEFTQQAVIIAQKVKNWLILADKQGTAQQLAESLQKTGNQCILVFSGEQYQIVNQHEYQINPTHFNDFEKLLENFNDIPLSIINLWSLDTPEPQNLDLETLNNTTQVSCTSTLNLIQSLLNSSVKLNSLYLVTKGAISTGNDTHISVAQSPLWGLGKVIALEHPELNCKRIDLAPDASLTEQVHTLLTELFTQSQENQIAYRDSIRKVARLARYPNKNDRLIIPQTQSFQLSISKKGTLENLQLQPMTRRQPDINEVEIKVRASGLNFIDVLDALSLLPFERNGFGVECSGEIVAVGEEVKGIKNGDSVIALAPSCLSQYVTVKAALVVNKPKSLTFTEAATIPANFLTAYYALHHIVKISHGQKILIHAASGGTGMAAVQIAKLAGAEVFATASPSKWDTLRRMGVKHIMNSRTLDFASEIQQITQGEGVDIVFNSLSGEFIAKSLSVLQDKGSFIEIGKREIWTSEQIHQLKRNVNYFLVDLMTVAQENPPLVQSMLVQLMQQFQDKTLQPLPYQSFPIVKSMAAFRTMQQARHIGKIVITQNSEFQYRGTYLITGGLGDLGLLVARWLIEKGIRHLVLISRRETDSSILEKIQELEQKGAKILIRQADVTQIEQIREVLAEIEQSLPPLRGVIHAAGVLDDGVLEQMNWSRFETVMAPKVQGAWHLHTLTLSTPLDSFILFSSAASLLGSPGQGNHVAANSFLDSLAHYRQSIGLSGMSINWGAWSEIGAAARKEVSFKGIGDIAPEQGLKILEQLITEAVTQVGVIPIDWSLFPSNYPFFADFSENKIQPKQQSDILQQIIAKRGSERQAFLIAYLQAEIGKVLGLPATQLPQQEQGFFDIGMDSLMSIELRNRLESNLGLSIPATAIFEYPTIKALSQYIIEKGLQLADTPLKMLAPTEVSASITQELEELEALLGKKQQS